MKGIYIYIYIYIYNNLVFNGLVGRFHDPVMSSAM
jgi:hypothetical protein